MVESLRKPFVTTEPYTDDVSSHHVCRHQLYNPLSTAYSSSSVNLLTTTTTTTTEQVQVAHTKDVNRRNRCGVENKRCTISFHNPSINFQFGNLFFPHIFKSTTMKLPTSTALAVCLTTATAFTWVRIVFNFGKLCCSGVVPSFWPEGTGISSHQLSWNKSIDTSSLTSHICCFHSAGPAKVTPSRNVPTPASMLQMSTVVETEIVNGVSIKGSTQKDGWMDGW